MLDAVAVAAVAVAADAAVERKDARRVRTLLSELEVPE
jgi:hypothetical protein